MERNYKIDSFTPNFCALLYCVLNPKAVSSNKSLAYFGVYEHEKIHHREEKLGLL